MSDASTIQHLFTLRSACPPSMMLVVNTPRSTLLALACTCDRLSLCGCLLAGEAEGKQDEDLASGTAVMMSAFATAGGGVGVAYANTAFRNLGLMEFELADLEGVVVQVGAEFLNSQLRRIINCNVPQAPPITGDRAFVT